jgi:hypothetical protein
MQRDAGQSLLPSCNHPTLLELAAADLKGTEQARASSSSGQRSIASARKGHHADFQASQLIPPAPASNAAKPQAICLTDLVARHGTPTTVCRHADKRRGCSRPTASTASAASSVSQQKIRRSSMTTCRSASKQTPACATKLGEHSQSAQEAPVVDQLPQRSSIGLGRHSMTTRSNGKAATSPAAPLQLQFTGAKSPFAGIQLEPRAASAPHRAVQEYLQATKGNALVPDLDSAPERQRLEAQIQVEMPSRVSQQAPLTPGQYACVRTLKRKRAAGSAADGVTPVKRIRATSTPLLAAFSQAANRLPSTPACAVVAAGGKSTQATPSLLPAESPLFSTADWQSLLKHWATPRTAAQGERHLAPAVMNRRPLSTLPPLTAGQASPADAAGVQLSAGHTASTAPGGDKSALPLGGN